MRKKVLILTNNSGGLYCFRKELISEMGKSCEIVCSTPFDDKIPELEALGCRLVPTELDRRGINPLKDLKLLRFYRRLIRAEKPDTVITYTIKPNLYGGAVCRLTKTPYVTNVTGLGSAFESKGALHALVVRMYRFALKKVKVVFFENSENRRIFLNERIVDEDRTVLLNGAGVNLDWFSVQPYPQNEVFRFLFIGRVMKEKGIEELLAAMEKLNGEGLRCFLDVLGGFDEDYKDVFRRCEEKGWLKYHGYQSDVRPFIKDCDAFVLPSYHEGMANTNLECASSGRPVITSNIPGCKEAVLNGKSGYLAEARNAESLYLAMKKMLQTENRAEMGLCGRRHMENEFDKKTIVERTISEIFR